MFIHEIFSCIPYFGRTIQNLPKYLISGFSPTNSEHKQQADRRKDTPEYILDVIASVMKALCIKIGASDDETDRCIQKVKERRMGYLFENMEKMNIQEERKLRADAQKRLEEAEKRLENAEKKLKETEKINEEKIKLATEQVSVQVAIQSIVESYQELGMSKELTQNKLIEKFNLTESEAKIKLEQYWN